MYANSSDDINLRSLSDNSETLSSETDIFTRPRRHEEFELEPEAQSFWKRMKTQALTYLNFHYLTVIKVLAIIVFVLLIIVATLSLLMTMNPDDVKMQPTTTVSAYIPIRGIEVQSPTENPEAAFERFRPTGINDIDNIKEKLEYDKKKIESIIEGRTSGQDLGPAAKIIPSKSTLCRKINCNMNKDFVIKQLNYGQLKIYGCCKSPSTLNLEAVSRLGTRYDLIYTSNIKFITFLPQLENLTGNWAEGSLNDQAVFVFRGIALKPPEPED